MHFIIVFIPAQYYFYEYTLMPQWMLQTKYVTMQHRTQNFQTVMISSSVVKKSCLAPNVFTNQPYLRNVPVHGVLMLKQLLLMLILSEMEHFLMEEEGLGWSVWSCFIWVLLTLGKAVCSLVTRDESLLREMEGKLWMMGVVTYACFGFWLYRMSPIAQFVGS